MDRVSFFKTFHMGAEIDIAGKFIYSGIKEFNRLTSFINERDIFCVLYQISVGIERLQKVLLVLVENITVDGYEEFEKSLITHSHVDLQNRIHKKCNITFKSHQNSFLHLINLFYSSCRYNRFNFYGDLRKERDLFIKYFSEKLSIEIVVNDYFFNTPIDNRIRNYFGRVVGSIAKQYYEEIKEQAFKLNIFTYELDYDSSAAKIFLPKFEKDSLQQQYFDEQVSLKEFIIFLMNTKKTSGFMRVLRSIDPLDIDVALADDYLADICKGNIPHGLVDEVECFYQDHVGNIKERLEYLEIIGKSGCFFDDEDIDDE